MTLYIDSRGGSLKPSHSRHLPTYLASHQLLNTPFKIKTRTYRYNPTITTLDFGDIYFIGNGPEGDLSIGIELKSIHDLVSSAYSKRLQSHQLPGMLESYDVSYLTYYGSYRPSTNNELMIQRTVRRGKSKGKVRWEPFVIGKRPVPYSWLSCFLQAVDDMGVRRERLDSKIEMVHWLSSLYRRYSKPWSDHKSFRGLISMGIATPVSMNEHTNRKIRAAGSIGAGFEVGLRAAKKFSSIVEMMTADEIDWMSIKGVGKGRAKEFVKRAHEGE